MKRLIFTLISIFCFGIASAQLTVGKKTGYQIEEDYKHASELKKTTLMVILENNDEFESSKLISSIKKLWNFNEIEFADQNQLKEILSNPKLSALTIYSLKSYETSKEIKGYGVGIFLGSKVNKDGELNKAKIVASMRLPSLSLKKSGHVLKDFDFISALITQNLQYKVNSYLNKETEKTFKVKNALFYDNGQSKIANQEILILDEIVPAKFDKEIFLRNGKLKSNNVKIVSKNEIESAIKAGDPKTSVVYDADGYTMNVYSADNCKQLATIAHKKMTGNKIYIYGVSIASIVVLALLAL